MPAMQFQGIAPTGDDIAARMDTNGGQIIKPFASGSKDWRYAAAAGGIVNTTAVAIKAAAGAGVRNALTAIQISNAHASVATEVTVSDGATVIWRNHLAAGTRMDVEFPTPLLGTANTALNVACVTTGAAVYVNAQGLYHHLNEIACLLLGYAWDFARFGGPFFVCVKNPLLLVAHIRMCISVLPGRLQEAGSGVSGNRHPQPATSKKPGRARRNCRVWWGHVLQRIGQQGRQRKRESPSATQQAGTIGVCVPVRCEMCSFHLLPVGGQYAYFRTGPCRTGEGRT